MNKKQRYKQLKEQITELAAEMNAVGRSTPEGLEIDENYEYLAHQFSEAWDEFIEVAPRAEILNLLTEARGRRDRLEDKAINPQKDQIPKDPRPYIAYENIQIAKYINALMEAK